MKPVDWKADDLIVSNASGVDVNGEPVTAFRLIDPERPRQMIWAFDRQSALEKAHELAAKRKVSIWYESDPQRGDRDLVKSYRD